jgi:hypothetical protein
LSIEQVFAVLSTEPFNRSFAEIGKMTPFQVKRILFGPKNDSGTPLYQEKVRRARPEPARKPG